MSLIPAAPRSSERGQRPPALIGSRLKEAAKSAVIAAASLRPIREQIQRLTYLGLYHNWCRMNPCPLVKDRIRLYELVAEGADASTAITYLEFGVFRGATLSWWINHNRHPDSVFIGFDTFTGLPEDWTAVHPKHSFSTGGAPPSIDDGRCSFQIGLFQETLPRFLRTFHRQQPLIIHMDADLFSATLFVLIQVAPIVRPGDVIIFDEFHDYIDEFRAYYCAIKAHPLNVQVVGATRGYGGRGYGRVALRVLPPA